MARDLRDREPAAKVGYLVARDLRDREPAAEVGYMRQPAPRVAGFQHKAYFRFCTKPTSDARQSTSRMPVEHCRTKFSSKFSL